MPTTTETNQSEVAKKINRTVVKYVAVRVIAGVATTVAGCMIANALDRKLNEESDETTDEN